MRDSDVRAFVIDNTLFVTTGGTLSGWTGRSVARYEVAKVTDVRSLESHAAFLVRCIIRLRVFRDKRFILDEDLSGGWQGYPSALITVVQPTLEQPVTGKVEVVNYSPKTINASVNSDHAQMTQSAKQLTRQHSAGSSATTTNSFGANIGGTMEGPSAGLSFEHSEVSGTSDEWMTGELTDRLTQTSESSGMTVKDWASFATMAGPAPTGRNPTDMTWVWAQEYPWDAVLMRPKASSVPLVVPPEVTLRLTFDGVLGPPSHLSQLGLDFVSQVTWLVTPDPASWPSAGEVKLDVKHSGVFWQATHVLNQSAGLTITPTSTPYPPTGTEIKHPIPLERLALVPITATGAANGAILPFEDDGAFSAFATNGFTMTSRADNLRATGTGFTQGITVDLSNPQNVGTITLDFKVLDRDLEYDLVFKHWTVGDQPAEIEIAVNPPAGTAPPYTPQVTRYVAEGEGEGGDNNVMTVALRSLTFGAVDYHDYLVVGLNTVVITIKPGQGPSQPSGGPQQYVLRALAVG